MSLGGAAIQMISLVSRNISVLLISAEVIWKRENEILAKHRAAFEKEGNLKIWDGRVADTNNMLKLFKDNRASRFLYSVEI